MTRTAPPAPAGRPARRAAALLSLTCLALLPGCITPPPFGFEVVGGFFDVAFTHAEFWKTTPLIPVTAFVSDQIEDTYHEEERYGRVTILPAVEGEYAPIFCLDPPSPDEVVRALPDEVEGGVPFLAETFHNNVRMIVEPIVDDLDDCKFFPLIGPARLHKCHYKCTVYYEKTIRSSWPIPFEHIDESQEVVYIDKDHLIMCGNPDKQY